MGANGISRALAVFYIDDRIDIGLSKYLNKRLRDDLEKSFGFEIEPYDYHEREFKPAEGYHALLHNSDLMKADVILIDSMLYENASSSDERVTGESLEVLFHHLMPYTEVFVVTQNPIRKESNERALHKYDGDGSINAQSYYSSEFAKPIGECVKRIFHLRKYAQELQQNVEHDIDIERAVNALEHITEYERLTSSDIDSLISSFEDVKGLIVNGK